MRIFLVIATLTAGGAERVMSLLANAWANKPNVEVHLVLLSDDEVFYELDKRIVIHKLLFPLRPSPLKRVTGFAKLGAKLRKLVNVHKPDFVLSFMNKYNIFTILSLLGTQNRVFVSERDSPTEKIPRLRELLRNLTYRYATGVITQTHSSKQFIEEQTGSKNVIVIPNPIKQIQLQEQTRKEKIILNVGRLVKKKGQKYLLEAFARLNCPGWKLVFIGDGALRNELESLAEALHISESVVFLGTVKDVDAWLGRASIFAFPSVLEGFPNALAEAMCAGLPCVSFDCETGPREIIIDGFNGYLVEERDIEGLTQKIQLLIDDEALRTSLSVKALEIRKDLSIGKVAEKFMEFCSTYPK